MVRRRGAEVEAAARSLGNPGLIQLGLPENGWNAATAWELLAPALRDADIIYAPSSVDFHPEHVRVARVVAGLVRPGQVVRVYELGVPLTPVLANLMADIGAVAAVKEQALAAFGTQAEALAALRRLARYRSRLYRRPAVEVFWELPAEAYACVIAASPWPGHPGPFRGIRTRPLADPLAALVGLPVRRALRDIAAPRHVPTNPPTPYQGEFPAANARLPPPDRGPGGRSCTVLTGPWPAPDITKSTPLLTIGIFLSTLGLVPGGLETWALGLAEALAERGHAVTLIGGYRPGHPLPRELAVLPVRWLRIPCIPARSRAWRSVARRRPGWPIRLQSLSFAYACRMSAQARGLIATADVTLTLLEVETVKIAGWRQARQRPNVSLFPGIIDPRRLRHDRSTLRIAISRMIAAQAARVPGLTIDGVVPPGVPQDWLQQEYAVRPTVRRLIFTGRLEANKGVRELLDMFAVVAARFPDVTLRLLGDGPLRAELEARCAGRPLQGRVVFAGAASAEQVRRELQAADLFVFPSHYESCGIAVLEALAAGVPVACSDLPALREVVGEAARLVPAADTAAWVTVLCMLIDDQELREQLSRAGRERARRFTWDRAAQDLEQHLLLAIERCRQPSGAHGGGQR